MFSGAVTSVPAKDTGVRHVLRGGWATPDQSQPAMTASQPQNDQSAGSH